MKSVGKSSFIGIYLYIKNAFFCTFFEQLPTFFLFFLLDNLSRRANMVIMTAIRAEQSRAEQSRAEQSRAEQSRAEQSRAEQSRAEQSRAEQSRAEQSRAEQSRAEQSRAEQSRAELLFCLKIAGLSRALSFF